ncbi:DUF3499 domain-containing protein [Psychromicrobium xiongbiense]|uniref:DUF3499 domain-containing protein n=1 Tax=Psychromicrobium xiongbiense TaxID=3051184 RepID=UPI0025566054|nr:DUF3499 domain-containing protein [Psychromicrobium sp. YIM S02556]
MGKIRQCSRSGCQQSAVATLTYVYADSTAVLGPLATYAEPHSYDLCGVHAQGLTVPRGWEVLRLAMPEVAPQRSDDDLLALADAVREAARSVPDQDEPWPDGLAQRLSPAPLEDPSHGSSTSARRGHLRILRD